MNRHHSSLVFRCSLFVFLLTALFLSPLRSQILQSSDRAKKPFYLRLTGSAYDRGVQHGRTLKTEIVHVLRRWKSDLQRSQKRDPDSLITEFLRETNFVPAIMKWTPDLLEEVRGIADGSGQPFNTVFAYQLPDEVWVYLDKLASHGCSGIGIVKIGSQPAFVAQNMDVESWRHGTQTVLHIPQSQTTPEQLIFTTAGLIGLNGVNNSSIGVCANTLMQLTASPNGLPVAFFIRGLLARNSELSALEFIKSVDHASGQNYILGVGDRVFDFEASATRVVRFSLVAGDSLVYHTNHPIANDDLKPWWAKWYQKKTAEELNKDNSRTRLASLKSRLSKTLSDINEGTIKETLRSKDSELHPVCVNSRGPSSAYTFGSTIMTLSNNPSLQVTFGPPDSTDYVLFSFISKSFLGK